MIGCDDLNWKHILEDAVRTRNAQKFLNNRFRSDSHSVVNNDIFKLCLNGTYFSPFNARMIEQTQTEYDSSKLKEDDVVLDIGANVGGFGLSVASRCKKVVLVEPLYVKELKSNIGLNNFNNVEVIEGALSPRDNLQIDYCGRSEQVKGYTLTDIIDMSGGVVDFLKCDCEGGEWCIKANELDGIRRIEMEVHSFHGEKVGDMIRMLEGCNFYVVHEKRSHYTDLLHCYREND